MTDGDAIGAAGELWDTHLHVIGDRRQFPLSPSRDYEPPDAPLASLLSHLDGLGIGRGVIVQPSVYGYDNACLTHAVRRAGGRCRGICVPAPDKGRAEFEAMHDAGMRGVRCNFVNSAGLRLEDTRPWWPWMIANGWHLDLQIDATRHDVTALGTPEDLPVVIDHMGYPPRGAGPAEIAALLAALGRGAVHVKLSAPYRISAEPAPYPDAQRLARVLLATNPTRCLFATDWPHTETTEPPMADIEWMATIRSAAGPDWPALSAAAAALYER